MQQINDKEKTVVTVKLRASRQKDKPNSWALVLRAYPVFENGKKKEKFEFLNRVITTPLWDDTQQKSGKGLSYRVKRDSNGIIVCSSPNDQESCNYADQVRKLRQREYDVAHIYEGHEDDVRLKEQRMKEDFFGYFERLNEQRHPVENSGSRIAWDLALRALRSFCGKKVLRFESINMRFINDYRSWLLKQLDTRYTKKKVNISNNTAAKHFMLFRAGLRQAYIDGYLDVDLHAKAKAINKQPKSRGSFSLEEIQRLAEAECSSSVLKRAALFSVLTGLRLGDIRSLQWKHIRKVGESWRIDFVQNKTKQTDYLPISKQAYEQCGSKRRPEAFVFDGMKSSVWIRYNLDKWLANAGIERHMTFHCFRHTFATLQLESGTDIYTIKSMLGHTSVNTTQIYSHIVDPSRRYASNLLYIDGLTIEF